MGKIYLNNSIKRKKQNKKETALSFVFICLLLCVFCVFKVLRGADTESTQSGGIWNIISLAFYPILFLAILNNNVYRLKTVFIAPLMYSVWAFSIGLSMMTGTFTISSAYQLIMIPFFFLVFATFYLITKPSKLGDTLLLFTYFGCLILNLVTIFKFQFLGADRPLASDIYFSLTMFPFVLQIIKNKKFKALLFIVEFIVVFLANKRTGLISFSIGTIAYILINSYNNKAKFFSTLRTIIFILLGVWVLYLITSYIDSTYNLRIYERLFKISEDGGSGRDVIYEKIWIAFKNSSFIEKLLGHGTNSTSIITGAGHAHNDFLEILYNYGIIAMLLIFVFYIALIIEALRMIKRRSPYAPSFAFSVIVGIFLSMFSYFIIFFTYVSCIMAFWGYTLAKEKARISKFRGK